MKTSELTGALLDYWVARAEGYTDAGSARRLPDHSVCVREVSEDGPLCCLIYDSKKPTGYAPGDDFFQPSTDWARGGPIIEREAIDVECTDPQPEPRWWLASSPGGGMCLGPSPLIAAMRAYVASKFGEEVPDQLG